MKEPKVITEKQCAPLAKMLSLSAVEVLNIFQNFQRMIFSEPVIDSDNRDHLNLRGLWLSIGKRASELQLLLLKTLPKNPVNARLRQYKFYQEHRDRLDGILSGLEMLTKSSGDHFIYLEKLAKGRKGSRSHSSELAYALLLKLWIDQGGKAAMSVKGPCASFLMDSSELILGAAPSPDTVPGIVRRAKATLAANYGERYSSM